MIPGFVSDKVMEQENAGNNSLKLRIPVYTKYLAYGLLKKNGILDMGRSFQGESHTY
jgi:hypothetical protein